MEDIISNIFSWLEFLLNFEKSGLLSTGQWQEEVRGHVSEDEQVPGADLHGMPGLGEEAFHLWLVVWNINFIFPYIENNHRNWLIFLRGVGQPPTRSGI